MTVIDIRTRRVEDELTPLLADLTERLRDLHARTSNDADQRTLEKAIATIGAIRVLEAKRAP